ncbi:MAG: hypothetical protein IJS78_02690 [Clostridia bacterium]|nr:hypothetical protein [Clostridia bacterium]
MEYLIGLDIGTSAVKGALMSEDGRIIRVAAEEFGYVFEGSFKLLYPEDFVRACSDVVRTLSASADGGIAALCSCCASGNPLFLGESSEPLTRIIGWQSEIPWDDLNKVYTKEEQKEIYRVVGWDFFEGMPAADLAWISLHRPDILEKTKMLVMSAEYLNFRLTGKWGVSRSMGTPFYLIDQEKGEYYPPMLDKFGLTADMLPPIYEKGTVLGAVTPDAAAKLGLDAGTAVVLGSFDHPSGALGAGVFDEGDLLLSCGTSWVELFPVASREFALSTGGLVDRFMIDGTPWCVMESIASLSDRIDALRRRLFGKISYEEFDGLAAAGEPGCRGLKFDFTEDDPGRAKGFGKPDIARAIIESSARLLRDNLSKHREIGLRADRITAIGGITNSRISVDIISSVMEREIRVVNGRSAGAVGSCLLAGIGVGKFPGEKEAFERMRGHQSI